MTEFLKGRETEVDRWKDGETHWNKQAIGLHEEKKKKKKKTFMSNYVPHFHGVAQELADIVKKFTDVYKDKFCHKAYNHMIKNTLGRITQ